MPYEAKDGDGSLFRNEKKGDNEKAPDYTGKLLMGGEEYALAGWVKPGKDGKKAWLSVRCKRKDESAHGQNTKAEQAQDDGEKLPF
jgi:hypothetical protein